MRRMDIEAQAPQPGISKRAPGHKIYPHLLRTLVMDRSHQVWALDTTYTPMARGYVERLWRSVKYARVYLKACDSVNDARADIAEYIGGYNIGRAHSSLADVTPDGHCFAQRPTIMAMAA